MLYYELPRSRCSLVAAIQANRKVDAVARLAKHVAYDAPSNLELSTSKDSSGATAFTLDA